MLSYQVGEVDADEVVPIPLILGKLFCIYIFHFLPSFFVRHLSPNSFLPETHFALLSTQIQIGLSICLYYPTFVIVVSYLQAAHSGGCYWLLIFEGLVICGGCRAKDLSRARRRVGLGRADHVFCWNTLTWMFEMQDFCFFFSFLHILSLYYEL
mgnify:CR=1